MLDAQFRVSQQILGAKMFDMLCSHTRRNLPVMSGKEQCKLGECPDGEKGAPVPCEEATGSKHTINEKTNAVFIEDVKYESSDGNTLDGPPEARSRFDLRCHDVRFDARQHCPCLVALRRTRITTSQRRKCTARKLI